MNATAAEHADTSDVLDLSSLTPENIRAMSYNELIGLVRETNRIPGGKRTIHAIASRLMLHQHSKVLEIGCATGSTSIELNRLLGCRPTALDLNPNSVTEAQRRADAVGANVEFMVADATNIPIADESFDVIMCGNTTALIDDKNAAIAEYSRLLREGGMLIAVPLYYVVKPDNDLVDRVRAAIQVNIPILYRDDALQFFFTLGFEIYDIQDYQFDDVAVQHVEDVSRQLLSSDHLSSLNQATKKTLDEVYLDYMMLFKQNMEILGFSIVYLRKTRSIEEPEVFTAHRIS